MKTKTYLIFTKPSGELLVNTADNSIVSNIDSSKFYVKEVELNSEIGEYWCGNYETGKIKNDSIPIITEKQLKYDTNLTILEEYPIHRQLTIMMEVLSKSGMPLTPEFVSMKSFIDIARKNHSKAVEVYKSKPESFTFISEEDDQKHKEALNKDNIFG